VPCFIQSVVDHASGGDVVHDVIMSSQICDPSRNTVRHRCVTTTRNVIINVIITGLLVMTSCQTAVGQANNTAGITGRTSALWIHLT